MILGNYSISIKSASDFISRGIFTLVRSLVSENLVIRKQQYFTVIFYLFITILLSNLVGLLPYSFTVTSSFVVTFYLALTHIVGINLIGIVRHAWYMLNLFLPSGAPLLIAPFLAVIEAISYFARVLSLSIRLFANMMSGHALLKILIGFSWAMIKAGSAVFLALAVLP